MSQSKDLLDLFIDFQLWSKNYISIWINNVHAIYQKLFITEAYYILQSNLYFMTVES